MNLVPASEISSRSLLDWLYRRWDGGTDPNFALVAELEERGWNTGKLRRMRDTRKREEV